MLARELCYFFVFILSELIKANGAGLLPIPLLVGAGDRFQELIYSRNPRHVLLLSHSLRIHIVSRNYPNKDITQDHEEYKRNEYDM